MLMKSNHTSGNARRKGFLSFGVLSPQNRFEQQTLVQPIQPIEPILEKKVQQAAFKAWRLRRYET
jgi:hypothetical protein